MNKINCQCQGCGKEFEKGKDDEADNGWKVFYREHGPNCSVQVGELRDAFLIAAAPEMLAILKTIRSQFENTLSVTNEEEVDRIIAKAEGSSK